MDSKQNKPSSEIALIRDFDWREAIKRLIFAMILGVICGLASVLLCLCVDGVSTLFRNYSWLIFTLPIMGILQLLLYRLLKLDANMTTATVIERMRANEKISYLLAPGILITTCMSVFAGGSVGKEAGALQMGASLGSLVSRPFKLKPTLRKSLNQKSQGNPLNGYVGGCGMAACFSALFFAPLGSCMLVLELSNFGRPLLRRLPSILLACFVAYLVAHTIGIGDQINNIDIPTIDWMLVGQCIVIGVTASLAGTILSGSIKFVHDATQKISKNYYVWVVIGGAIYSAIVIGCKLDSLTGTGGETLALALQGDFGPWDFAIKALLTLLCIGFWFKGGEIMPSLCIGGLLGASCSFLTGGDATFGAAIGALSLFSAFSRCPFAAFLMGCEIFGWNIAPFLAISIFVSYIFGYPVGMYGANLDKTVVGHLHEIKRNKSA